MFGTFGSFGDSIKLQDRFRKCALVAAVNLSFALSNGEEIYYARSEMVVHNTPVFQESSISVSDGYRAALFQYGIFESVESS